MHEVLGMAFLALATGIYSALTLWVTDGGSFRAVALLAVAGLGAMLYLLVRLAFTRVVSGFFPGVDTFLFHRDNRGHRYFPGMRDRLPRARRGLAVSDGGRRIAASALRGLGSVLPDIVAVNGMPEIRDLFGTSGHALMASAAIAAIRRLTGAAGPATVSFELIDDGYVFQAGGAGRAADDDDNFDARDSGVSEEDLERVVRRYRAESIDEGAVVSGDCTVCFEQVAGGEGLVLPCKHAFHVQCGRRWFERQMTCPTCRASVR